MQPPPPHSSELKVAFPAKHVLLLSLNRPKSLNAMTRRLTNDLETVLNWFEQEPELWVVIVTGEGRLFCAGADLIGWNADQQNGVDDETERVLGNIYGFGSISRRQSCKPVIAAVIGGAYGGGVEMVLNCDLVVVSEDARFGLPEVRRGVVACQGGIPRLAQIAGHQLASEMLLTGKTINADEALNRFGFVNMVVPGSKVLSTAISLAEEITANSPDAVQSSKVGLVLSQNHNFVDTFKMHNLSLEGRRVYKGANIKEGLKAFSEKRAPNWINPSKL